MIVDTTQTKIERQLSERICWICFFNHIPEPGGIIEQIATIQNVTDELMAQGHEREVRSMIKLPTWEELGC